MTENEKEQLEREIQGEETRLKAIYDRLGSYQTTSEFQEQCRRRVAARELFEYPGFLPDLTPHDRLRVRECENGNHGMTEENERGDIRCVDCKEEL